MTPFGTKAFTPTTTRKETTAMDILEMRRCMVAGELWGVYRLFVQPKGDLRDCADAPMPCNVRQCCVGFTLVFIYAKISLHRWKTLPPDILAERSKALCSGRSLNWRRFESCRCHFYFLGPLAAAHLAFVA